MERNELAKYIDHTLLRPDAAEKDIVQLCEDAKRCGFASVCIHPYYIETAARLLEGSDVKVCSVVGFPLGQNTAQAKAEETRDAVRRGAQELDMVLNVAAAKDGKWDYVRADIAGVKNTAGNAIVKVILETVFLTDEEKTQACREAQAAGADFVKTCTGFSGGAATEADVRLMRATVGAAMGVKAAGGIRTKEDAERMIAAGANRIGTSAGVDIVQR